MKSAKSYIDREELLEYLKDMLIPCESEELKSRITEYEYGYKTAVMDMLREVESLV